MMIFKLKVCILLIIKATLTRKHVRIFNCKHNIHEFSYTKIIIIDEQLVTKMEQPILPD